MKKTCEVCGAIHYPNYSSARFCSHKCFAEYRRGKKRENFTPEWKEKMRQGRLGEKHPLWNGGRARSNGYITETVKDHPFADSRGRVYAHRLSVEKILGKFLPKDAPVHHLNGIKTDNRPENLVAFEKECFHQMFHKDPASVGPQHIIFDGRSIQAGVVVPSAT